MAIMGHAFAGLTDFFRAFGAKSYGDVLSNASKRYDPTAVSRRSTQMVSDFAEKLSKNENLTPQQIQMQVAARNGRHAVGDLLENTFSVAGAAGSFVGGSMGYGAKKAAQAVFSKNGMKMGGISTGAAGVAGATKALVNNADAVIDAVGDAMPVVGALGAANALRKFGPTLLQTEKGQQITKAVKKQVVNTNAAIGEGIKSGTRWAGKESVAMGKDVGSDILKGAKWFHENRNSRGMTIGVAAGAIALMPVAYDGGLNEGKYEGKMRQVASNMSISNDGGGTFLRPNQSPTVEDMGATGDLVFALHSLRNGG